MVRYAGRGAWADRRCPTSTTRLSLDDTAGSSPRGRHVTRPTRDVMRHRSGGTERLSSPGRGSAPLTNTCSTGRDVRRGRVSLTSWLAEHAPGPPSWSIASDPGSPRRGPPGSSPKRWRVAGARLPDRIPARHLRWLFVCGRRSRASLRHARRDRQFPWGPRRPKLPRQEVYGTTLRSLLTAGRGPDLRGELRLVTSASAPFPAGRP
jgi:hypothetical protein